MSENIDRAVEEKAMRQHGLIGRGDGMGNAIYAIDITGLPPEAQATIRTIINRGPFPFPRNDARRYSNRFGDLPSGGTYLEFTVPTPGAADRGKRRIVARSNGVLFFTACHYERFQPPRGVRTSPEARIAATQALDAEWRNGFYVVTGIGSDVRKKIADSIRVLVSRLV